MEPTEAQLRQLYQLIQFNWKYSRLLYEFAPDLASIYVGCYLAVFATPIDNSNYEIEKVYYIYTNGSFLDEDDLNGGYKNGQV